MAKTATILTRTEPEVKEKADKIFARLGLTTSGAINIFLHQTVEEQGMPFRAQLAGPDIPNMDELSREEINALINEGLDDIKAGRVRPAEQVFAELEEKYGFAL